MFIGNFKEDDFLQESFDPFIKQRKNTNIINSLVTDENAKALICEQFVQNFATKGRKILVTEFHLQWALECIGFSFSLPAKRFFNTLITSLTIYSDWLCYPDYSPEFIKTNRSFYVQEILGHMSLAFYPQKDISKQSEICTEILNAINKFTNIQELSEDSWNCLLKLSLEIGKSVLINIKLTELIGNLILKFIFQMFLRTSSRDLSIWKEFKQFLWKFSEYPWISIYWAACLQGLSMKVIKYLMGKNKKFLAINFASQKNTQEEFVMDKDPEAVIYLWSRFLDVFLWNQEDISVNRFNIVFGVCASLDLFLKQAQKLNLPKHLKPQNSLIISTSSSLNTIFTQNYQTVLKYLKSECRLPSFTVNSLLSPFGDSLFTILSSKKPAENEKSEALKLLCSIFEKAQGPINMNYIEKFLSCIIQCIANKDPSILSIISEKYISLPSVSIHFLNFTLKTDIIVQVVNFFLLNGQCSVQTRLFNYKLLTTFSALASFYNISGLCQQISEVFLVSVELETDEKCFEILLLNIASYLACFKGDADIMNAHLRMLTEKLESFESTSQSYFNIIDVLNVLPYLVDKKSIRVETVNFCIRKMLNLLNKRGKNPEEHIFRVFQCIIDYLLCFPAVLMDAELKIEVLKAVESRRIEDKVRNFQSYLYDLLFSMVGKACKDKCSGLGKDWDDCIEFHTENIHGSFIETEDCLKILIKNSTGEYLWALKEVISANNKRKVEEKLKIDVIECENKHVSLEAADSVVKELNETVGDEVRCPIFDKFCKQEEICGEFYLGVRESGFGGKKCGEGCEQSRKSGKSDLFRRITTQLSYLNPDSAGFLFKIDKDCNKDIVKFDSLPFAVMYSVKIIYLPTIETSPSDSMSSIQPYSSSYKKFLNSLGRTLTESDPYPASCEKILKKYTKGIYKDHKLFELIYTSPSLFPENLSVDLLDFAEFGHLIVLWNQRLNDPNSLKQPLVLDSLNTLQKPIIVITPISKKIVKIKTFNLASGLLVDNMVISCKAISKLLAFTVHLANYKFSQRFSLWKNKFNYLKELAFSTPQERLSIRELMWIFQ